MNLIEIFFILIVHWIADFVLQSDEMAKGKSKKLIWLFSHTLTYSLFICAVGLIVCIFKINYNPLYVFAFTVITFICHTVQDYFTSKLNAAFWAKGERHNFFVSIGFDQLLHYIQLFFTYYLLIKW